MIERGPLPQRGYLVVQNEVVRDETLSFKARGILVFLLSQPPGYSTSAERIADEGPDGRAAVLSGLKELEQAGYLVRRRERLGNGQFVHKDVVYDSPQREKPEAENRLLVLPAETHESAGQARSGLSVVGKPADKDLVPREEVREEVPVPVASDEPNAGQIVKGFIDWCDTNGHARPANPGQLGKAVSQLLAAHHPPAAIKRALCSTSAFTLNALEFELRRHEAASPTKAKEQRTLAAIHRQAESAKRNGFFTDDQTMEVVTHER